jgi:probable FeS assembly SUF system protein SufT
MQKTIIISNNIRAYRVPTAEEIDISEGSKVTIMQSLGNKYTILFDDNLYRVNEDDNFALGFDNNKLSKTDIVPTSLLIREDLKSCYDPEIPVNIVDLGLIYASDIINEGDVYIIKVLMTLTAPGCSMGDVLANDIKRILHKYTKVKEVQVEFTFDPLWDQTMISEAGKLELGLL